MVIYGVTLILCVQFLPGGLISLVERCGTGAMRALLEIDGSLDRLLRAARARARLLRGARGRDRRPDRPERRRQVDAAQLHVAPVPADSGTSASGARALGATDPRGGRVRHPAHVPEPGAVPRGDGARERDPRRGVPYRGRWCRPPGPVSASEREAATRADDLLHDWSRKHADTRVSALPYGSRNRSSWRARSPGEPKLLLLDEPAAGMNPGGEPARRRDHGAAPARPRGHHGAADRARHARGHERVRPRRGARSRREDRRGRAGRSAASAGGDQGLSRRGRSPMLESRRPVRPLWRHHRA